MGKSCADVLMNDKRKAGGELQGAARIVFARTGARLGQNGKPERWYDSCVCQLLIYVERRHN